MERPPLDHNTNDNTGNDVLITRRGGFVHLLLNRPQALNALSYGMIRQLGEAIAQGVGDEAAAAFFIEGAGDRAFCAGGDIKAAYFTGLKEKEGANEGPATLDYFGDEYALNAAIFHSPKPYVAYLNGITMGGGFGVSGHGTHVLATEKTSFAMPEVGIGFFPDIGSVYHLSRLPFRAGLYLGLTGISIGPGDLLACGLATSFIALAQKDAFERALWETDGSMDAIDECIGHHATWPEMETIFQTQGEVIDRCFAHESAEAIIDALKTDGTPFAVQTAALIESRCPLSVKVTLRHIRDAAAMDFDAVIARDLALAGHFMRGSEFYEGVRAAVVDKDRKPRWKHAALSDVSDAEVKVYFDNPIA